MDDQPSRRPPEGIEPPIQIDSASQQYDFWDGDAKLIGASKTYEGQARVFLDLLPYPAFRFQFAPHQPASVFESLLNPAIGEAVLEVGDPIGHSKVHVTSSGREFYGSLQQQLGPVPKVASLARFLIINGPLLHGAPISRGNGSFLGRLSAKADGLVLTVDQLSSQDPGRRCLYAPTHVASCEFASPTTIQHIDELKTLLFRVLSLMKCRWVGIVGPWLFDGDGKPIGFRASVTKSAPYGRTLSWCHESMGNYFQNVLVAARTALCDEQRSPALITALHWLVEAEQCAGGVEGSLILQQAALECLAWLEIVQCRGICSVAGFKPLPAADKIRWLLSLYRICAAIPEKSAELSSYARAFNLNDMVEVLTEVRNALVHADPKLTARVFKRRDGEDERTDLWYQIGGIVQQAVLATIGYQGQALRRDVEAEYAVSAIRPVPWSSS